MSHNGWTNWATWEAFNLLTSYEDIYASALKDHAHDNLEALLLDALTRCGADIEHLMFHEVNFEELFKAFEEE